MKNLIILTGHSGAGKTLCASHLKDNHGALVLSFGHSLKKVVHDFLCSMYPDGTWDFKLMDDLEYKEQEHPQWIFDGKKLRVRDLLIYFGMKMREHNPNIWANIVAHRIREEYDNYEMFVITDNRFINEADVIWNLCSRFDTAMNPIGIQIKRESQIVNHNETDIPKIVNKYNYSIINNYGDQEELFDSVNEILKKHEEQSQINLDTEFASAFAELNSDDEMDEE